MIMWGTVVTPLQFVGNGIAMTGLVYYNLGGEEVSEVGQILKARWTGNGKWKGGRVEGSL